MARQLGVRGLLVAVAALALLAGCQQAPAPKSASTAPVPAVARLRAEGDGLAARGDYMGAAAKYQEAVALAPADISLRFALGTALSFLDRREEAITQFKWVVSQGDPDSAEYREARRWLARVGALVETAAAPEQSEPTASLEVKPDKGRVVGRTEWPGVNPHDRMIRGRIGIQGDEPGTAEVKLSRPFRLGDRYEFKDLPPGRYRLVAAVDSTTLWDQKITVEPGKLTEVNLSQASSPVSPDKFPGPETKDQQ